MREELKTDQSRQFKNFIMDKNHEADISNSNSGTSGTNGTYQDAQDNHANQLNPNNEEYQG